jgi:TolB-like protein
MSAGIGGNAGKGSAVTGGRGAKARTGLLALLLGLTLAGCGLSTGASRDFTSSRAALPASARIAVLPLENLTSHPNAGVIASELISTELYRRNLFVQTEPTRARNQLAAAKIEADRLADTSYGQKVAELLGVDAVLVGSVSEYGYQHGLREEPTVGMTVRLVRAGDGTVLWASSQSEVGMTALARESVNEVAQRVVARMLEALARSYGASYGAIAADRTLSALPQPDAPERR